MNGQFEDGFAPVPFTNDGVSRWSAARSYLPEQVRRRPNLRILAETEVSRIRFEGKRAVGGVDARRGGIPLSLDADMVIVTGGRVSTRPSCSCSPASGRRAISPQWAFRLSPTGRASVPICKTTPSIYVSCYMPPEIRSGEGYIGPASYLRYSSGVEGCAPSDMVMISAGRSGWHAVGRQLATLVTFIGIPFSRGAVRLAAPDSDVSPDVCFNFLDDWRDRKRLIDAFRTSAEILTHGARRAHHRKPLPIDVLGAGGEDRHPDGEEPAFDRFRRVAARLRPDRPHVPDGPFHQ